MSRLDHIAMVLGYLVIAYCVALGVVVAFFWAFWKVFVVERKPAEGEEGGG